jgi:hypothetical protein
MTTRQTTRLVTGSLPVVFGIAIAVALRGHSASERITVVVTGAYLAGVLLARIRHSAGARTPTPAPYRREAVEPLAQLARIERSVVLSASSRLEFEHRLQPDLRHLAAERLRLRRGINLERRPDAARAVLGEHAWDMVMRRGAASDRRAPAPALAEIRELFELLERV